MTALILGLVLFLGLHSIRIVAAADGARSRFVAQLGPNAWRGLYSLVSAVGLVLIVWGYSLTLQQPVVLRAPPAWVRMLTSALTLPAIVLIAAAYVPRNHFKVWVGHPMVLGTALWAFAHLLATRTLADVLLFGGFLIWAVLCFRSLRARDRAAGVQRAPGAWVPSVIATGVGAALWFAFGRWAHAWLIGINPFA